jgi:hypothetical protein
MKIRWMSLSFAVAVVLVAGVSRAQDTGPVVSSAPAAQEDGAVTNAFGQAAADLVFTPVTPCRIIDTRLAGGPIAAGTTRSFKVTGAASLAAQGGSGTGCGVPVGATAAFINFVAVGFAGFGDLRAFPFGAAVPTASILNYAIPGQNLNLANGIALKICDPSLPLPACTNDFTIQADASATDLVADVLGYYARPVDVVTLLRNDSTTGAVDPDASPTICQTADFTPTFNTRAVISGTVCLLTAGAMNFTTFPRVSSDGGVTFVFAGSGNFTRAGSDVAGVWACATKFGTLDLTAGTQYRFGMMAARDTGTADATASRCDTHIQLFPR